VGLSSYNKARGTLKLVYNSRGRYHLEQREPLRLLFISLPEMASDGAVLLNLSGGVAGGDEHRLILSIDEKSSLFLTSQTAERVYGTDFLPSSLETTINVHENAWVEWFPQETILFKNAHVKRSLFFNIHKGGHLMAGDIVVFGRIHHGEHFDRGFFHDVWRVNRASELLWLDSFLLKERETFHSLHHNAGLRGARAYGTLIYVADNAHNTLLDAQKILNTFKSQDNILKSSITAFQHLLILRFISHNPQDLKHHMFLFWGAWRHHIRQLPQAIPRFWGL
jgi:urease accessory protein